MLTLLFLLACSADIEPEVTTPPPAAPAPAPAEDSKREKTKVPKAAWVGDWVMGDKILATDDKGEMKLMQDGDVVMMGTLEGKGLRRTAALDGCGAKLKLSGVGGDITVVLDGPECAVDFAGTYTNTVSP